MTDADRNTKQQNLKKMKKNSDKKQKLCFSKEL